MSKTVKLTAKIEALITKRDAINTRIQFMHNTNKHRLMVKGPLAYVLTDFNTEIEHLEEVYEELIQLSN